MPRLALHAVVFRVGFTVQRAVVAGVSSHNQAPAQKVKIRAWRDSMEFFVIRHYRQCLPILRDYDLVGECHSAWMRGILRRQDSFTITASARA